MPVQMVEVCFDCDHRSLPRQRSFAGTGLGSPLRAAAALPDAVPLDRPPDAVRVVRRRVGLRSDVPLPRRREVPGRGGLAQRVDDHVTLLVQPPDAVAAALDLDKTIRPSLVNPDGDRDLAGPRDDGRRCRSSLRPLFLTLVRCSMIVIDMSSVASTLRDRIESAPPRSFLRTAELCAGVMSRGAADTALSRLADDPTSPVIRVRRGLYWRGIPSRFGKGAPSATDIVLAVVGDRGGIGPSGWSASRDLGLTTQRPAIEEFATIATPPTGIRGVRFHRRSNPKRAALRYLEIAALEAVRDWPAYSDGDWDELVRAVKSLVRTGKIRVSAVRDAARFEPPTARERLASLLSAIT